MKWHIFMRHIATYSTVQPAENVQIAQVRSKQQDWSNSSSNVTSALTSVCFGRSDRELVNHSHSLVEQVWGLPLHFLTDNNRAQIWCPICKCSSTILYKAWSRCTEETVDTFQWSSHQLSVSAAMCSKSVCQSLELLYQTMKLLDTDTFSSDLMNG